MSATAVQTPMHTKFGISLENTFKDNDKIAKLDRPDKIQIAIERVLKGKVVIFSSLPNDGIPFREDFLDNVARVLECLGKKVVCKKVSHGVLNGKEHFVTHIHLSQRGVYDQE